MKKLKDNIKYDLYNQAGKLVATNVCKKTVLKIYDSFDFFDENIRPSKSKNNAAWFSDEVTQYYPGLNGTGKQTYFSKKELISEQESCIDFAISNAKDTGRFKMPESYLETFLELSVKKYHNLELNEKGDGFLLRLQNGVWINPERFIVSKKYKDKYDKYFSNFGTKKTLSGNLSENEILELLINNADDYRMLKYSENNFYLEFGKEQSVITPIGEAVLYEDQFEKIYERKREHYFGLIKPTLQKPIIIIEHNKRILFIKTFINRQSNTMFFVSVTKDESGFFEVVSNHEKTQKQILKRIKDGNIRYISENLSGHGSSLNAGSDVAKHHPKYISVSFGIPLSFTKVRKKNETSVLSGYYDLTSGVETEFDSYLQHIENDLRNHKKHNKRTVEKIAASYGITNKNIVKETTELAIVKIARSLANQKDKTEYERYLDIVELYNNQVNLSHRTSRSTMFQQYSTPAPISYIASLFVSKSDALGSVKRGGRFTKNHFNIPKTTYKEEPRKLFNRKQYFEPSAGNGLLTIALPMQNTIVNEVDDIRLANLRMQDFEFVSNQDASMPFPEYYKKFDGVITNPPFSTLPEPVIYDGFPIKHLDHLMALRALDTMKDNGRAAIIVGGHTIWDEKGRPRAGKNRIFLNYLYSHYKVDDIILIDGYKLYSRQGTAFDIRLILIDGRKQTIEGHAPLKTPEAATVIADFEDLWIRVYGSGKKRSKRLKQILKETDEKTKQKVSSYANEIVNKNKKPKIKQVWEMTSKELIKNTIENMDIFKNQSSANWFIENSQIEIIDKRTGESYNHYKSIKVTPAMLRKYGKEAHYNLIKKALRQGKKVPENVLSEYPDLFDENFKNIVQKVWDEDKLMRVKKGDTIYDDKGAATITKKHKPKPNTPFYGKEEFLVDIKRENGHKALNMPISNFMLQKIDKNKEQYYKANDTVYYVRNTGEIGKGIINHYCPSASKIAKENIYYINTFDSTAVEFPENHLFETIDKAKKYRDKQKRIRIAKVKSKTKLKLLELLKK